MSQLGGASETATSDDYILAATRTARVPRPSDTTGSNTPYGGSVLEQKMSTETLWSDGRRRAHPLGKAASPAGPVSHHRRRTGVWWEIGCVPRQGGVWLAVMSIL